ncbi:MAG TPA: hypothetical protein VMV87_07015 [Burkholderiales bacterium]|nr:hypothetical protein [Burkholderiales bacterium]
MTACGSVPADAKYGPLRSTEGSHDYLRDILIDQIPLRERSGRLARAELSEPEIRRLYTNAQLAHNLERNWRNAKERKA